MLALPAASRRPTTALLMGLALVVGYVSATLGGILIINDPQTLWPLWPGCAVLVAFLLLCPRRIWLFLVPAGLIGFILYDLQAGVPIRSIAWLVVADVAEIFVTAEGLHRLFHGAPNFDSLRAFAKYCLVTVILGPVAASSIGLRALSGDPWISWRSNVLSEGLAFLTVTPAILSLVRSVPLWKRASRAYKLEAAALILGLVLASYALFVARGTNAPPALLYSLLPFLVWSAVRFGSAGASTAASIVALLSIWGAIHGRSPFVEPNSIDRVFSLQLFLFSTAVPFMVLAVLAEERKRQEAVLRESEERFRLMADTAPTMIWMSGTDKLCNFFNRGWLNFTGRTLQQEFGDGWLSGVHPEDRQRCLEIYVSAFDARRDFRMEYRLLRYDGEFRWIVDCGVPRFSPNGAFCGYIGSCLDITERKLSEMSLHDLTGRLIHAQEEERARIARELHDDISQRLAFLQIGLEQFEQSVRELPANRRKELHNLTNVASEVSSDLHSMSHQLHPARLDLQGLVAAMGSLCREFMAQHELQINFVHEDVPNQISTDVALCLFRIAQEALRNVVKHGKTSDAQVKLSGCGDGIDLCITDSGSGFDPDCAQLKGGLGLVSMSERLRILGGRLEVGSAVSRGTQIRAWVPLAGSASELNSSVNSHNLNHSETAQ
jgi:PAS domain S-box-containing protein